MNRKQPSLQELRNGIRLRIAAPLRYFLSLSREANQRDGMIYSQRRELPTARFLGSRIGTSINATAEIAANGQDRPLRESRQGTSKTSPITFVFLAALVASCGADEQTQSRVPADASTAQWVLSGGRIYTMDDSLPWAEAVAVAGDRFVYVGDDAGARAYVGVDTRQVDLKGRMVIPGLIDGHTHPGYIDLERYGPPLPETSREDLLDAVARYAENSPGAGWIRMCCWPNHLYVHGGEGPHRRDLDAIVPDRPVWITSTAWHSYWLNSKGLETLGIEETASDPLPGIAMYQRDENGALTGWIKEGAGWQHFAEQFPVDAVSHEESVTAFLRTLSEHGVTTVYDGGNFGYENHVYGFLSELDRNGDLPVRYEGTYQIFVPERREFAIREMKRLRSAYGGERLRFRTIKLFMDGVYENHSAGMLAPYSDDPAQVSNTMLTAEELRDFLLELHEEKFDLHIHAIGDLAVRTALDAVEAARAAVGGDLYPRVTLAHLQLIDPADLSRFRELGVTANFTPWWHGADRDDTAAAALGDERAARTYTARSLFDLGARVTFSSDDWELPVLSPFLGMEVAHNRRFPREWLAEEGGGASDSRPPESERLALERILEGYTIHGAFPFRMEDQIGSIEVGKLADLVVLAEKLFEMDRHEIHRIKPAAVMLEGDLVQGALP
jgi:predicted amidohydrolase YtcJ